MLLPIFFYNSPLLLKLKRFQLGQQNIARVQVGVVGVQVGLKARGEIRIRVGVVWTKG